MDFLLAAKVQVTGVDGAVSDLQRLERQIRDVGAAADISGDIRKLATALKAIGADAAIADLGKLDAALKGLSVDAAVADLNRLQAEMKGIKAVGDLNVKVDARGAKEAAEEVGRLGKTIENITTGAAYTVAYRGFDALIAAAKEAKEQIIGFDEAMVNALSIQPQGVKLLRDDMEALARSISVDLGMNVRDVGEGFYYLASAGLSAADQMEALPVAAAMAKGGMMDLEKATEMLSQAWAIFRLGTNAQGGIGYSFEAVADQITQAANLSQGTIEQFAAALTNKAGTAAVRFKVSLEDTMAVLMAFHERGVQGKVAGEQFSIVLRDLAIKAEKNSEAFEKFGIKVFDANGNLMPLLDIIGQLSDRYSGMNEQQRTAELGMLGFTLRSQGAIAAIVQMSDRIDYFRTVSGNALGETLRVAQEQMQSLQAQFDQAKAWTINLAITGFEKMMEFGAWLVDTFRPAFEAIAPAAEAAGRGVGLVAEAVGLVVGGAAAATIMLIADAIEAIGTFASQHQTAVTLFAGALTGLAAVQTVGAIAGLVQSFGPLAAVLGSTRAAAQTFAAEFTGALVNGLSPATGALNGAKSAVGGLASALLSPTAAIAAIAGGFTLLYKQSKDAEEGMKAFGRATLDMNLLTAKTQLEGYTQTLADMQKKIAELTGPKQSFLDRLKEDLTGGASWKDLGQFLGIDDLKNSINDIFGTGAINGAKEFGSQLNTSLGYVKVFAEVLKGANIGPTMDENVIALSKFADMLPTATGSTNDLVESLLLLTEKNNIDLKKPVQDWLPALATAYQESLNLGDGAGIAAEAVAGLGDAAEDAAASVEDLASSFRDMMVGLNETNSAIAFQEALAKIVDTAKETGITFDITTAAGREFVSTLTDAAARAVDYAEATSKGDAGLFVKNLEASREALIGVATNIGMSQAEAEKFVDSLGLSKSAIQEMADTARNNPVEIKAQMSLEAAQQELSQYTSQEQIVTIEGKAALALAESDLAAFTGTSRTTTITAGANAIPADRQIRDVSEFPWQTTITAGANAIPADRQIRDVSDFPYSAYITAIADARAAGREIDYAARDRQAYIDLVVRTGSYVPGMYEADGGVVDYFAKGGFSRERHVAQIAPAGAYRVWAEPETGGEAYIPLAAHKRDRSRQIWLETGRRLGMVEQFAAGKVVGPSFAGRVGMSGGGGLTISPGAVQVRVDAPGAVDPLHVKQVVEDAIGPALDGFASDLITHIRRRTN